MNDFTIDFSNPCKIHFIGIGGISMSGLAHVLLKEGFTVTGSDSQHSALTDELEAAGAIIGYPQKPENIADDVKVVVFTAAIHEDNPEFIRAKSLGVPMLTRSKLLGQIMEHYKNSIAIAGTHGKTTTTSMLSVILLEADKDPTISVGGILNAIHGNIRIGSSDVFLTEACEYTNSFHDFFPRYSIILNIEEDHLDFFKDINDIRNSFRIFAEGTKDGGTLIINGAIDNLDEITKNIPNVSTYGMDASCDFHPADISYDEHGCATYTLIHGDDTLGEITLSVPGEHNVENSLAAASLAHIMGIDPDAIASGLSDFTGTDRRFQYKGKVNGADLYDDYAHHPTEISATLKTAKSLGANRVICVFQPHTYTRTLALMDDFVNVLSEADIVVMAEIYAAREQNTTGLSSKVIADRLTEMGRKAYYFETFDEIKKFLLKKAINGDLLITMGAGNIVNVGDDLIKG